MLSKVLTVVKSKAALAVLGVVLVGGGAAAAYAATGHQVPLTSNQGNASAKSGDNGKPDATHNTHNNHGHTVSIEGVLKGYNAGAATISVESRDGNSTTTITVNAGTRINGDQASALADLARNIGHRIEVQADKQSNGKIVAWKVTVQGATASVSVHDNSNGGQSHALHRKSRVSA